MVFSGIYPINTADFEHLKAAIGKLQLNDSAFVYQPESSVALGFGFRCGFLGLLHMEIIQERLRREYDMDIIATSPERGLRDPDDARRNRCWSIIRRICRTRASSTKSASRS